MKDNINVKQPAECQDISEVRHEIDNIDRTIIQLLSKRFQYVKEVVKYKDSTPSAIEATDRRIAVINSRREWAEQSGFNPDIVEKLYNDLIDFFINEEMNIVKQNTANHTTQQ